MPSPHPIVHSPTVKPLTVVGTFNVTYVPSATGDDDGLIDTVPAGSSVTETLVGADVLDWKVSSPL